MPAFRKAVCHALLVISQEIGFPWYVKQNRSCCPSCSSNTAQASAEREQSFTDVLNQIHAACGLPEADFQRHFAEARADVERYYSQGRFDIVFRGKWYSAILCAELHQHLAGKPANLNALEVRLTLAIAQTLDIGQAWANYFKAPLGNLAATYLN